MDKGMEQFTVVARQFCKWAETEFPADLQSARQALELITELYLCGVQLVVTDEIRELEEDLPDIGSRGRMSKTVYANASTLPLKYYSEIFNPLPIPAEKPVVGNLADDITDIYIDITHGLDLLDAGYIEHAVWVWIFYMQHHWGHHATSAINALHWFLSEQDAFI